MTNYITMRVLRKDRDRLFELFGAPAERAFHNAIVQVDTNCPHYEPDRIYTTAIVGTVDGLKVDEAKQVSGFFCKHCRRYVFVPEEEDEREEKQA